MLVSKVSGSLGEACSIKGRKFPMLVSKVSGSLGKSTRKKGVTVE